MRIATIGVVLLVPLAAEGPALAQAPSAGPCGLSAREIYAAAADSVVEVFGVGIDPYRLDRRVKAGTGTGFVIGGGLVATNFHVVAGANSIGLLFDDFADDAFVVGIDPSLDLAVIAPRMAPLPEPLPFAGVAPPPVGAQVFALGFPLGVGRSISAGIVSGQNRVLPRSTSSWLSPFLQTDAAISPGSYGGPLLDDCGRVVGMVTLGSTYPGVENLGFVIPNAVLTPVLEAVARDGHVARPWHGLFGQMATPPILGMMGFPPEAWADATGFLVETVEPGSAADRAGLTGGYFPVLWGGQEIVLGGDIITRVDDRRILTLDDALEAVRSLQIGDTVEIGYLRDGEAAEASVEIEERPLLEAEMRLYDADGMAREP